MVIRDSVKITHEIQKIKKDIFAWYSGKEEKLNVISPPYNSSNIFLDIIIHVAGRGKKVLYMSTHMGCLQIINNIKSYTNFKDYTIIKDERSHYESSLVVLDFNFLECVKNKFDLIVCDNINGICSLDYNVMREVCDERCKENGKILSYAIEPLFQEAREFIIPVRDNGSPITEPTVFFTRLNINKNIPYVVYEYLDWAIRIDKKTIIYVPDKDKVCNVYNYLLKLKNKLRTNMDFYIDNVTDKKTLINFSKKKGAILVTNYLGEEYLDFNNINIMVYFADDEIFDYKKLVYLSGRTDILGKFEKGEVIFLAKKETDDMARAKNMTRKFNREAWEMGLLSI